VFAVSAIIAGTSMASPSRTPDQSAPRIATGDLRVIEEPSAGMAPIYALVRSATRSVDVVMYELSDPTFEALLAGDASRGVHVRVILDREYEESANAPAFSYLQAHGVEVHWSASRFGITHEKAIVVDETTALVMTLNLTARYYATTRDVAIVDKVASDIAAIETTFDGDWSGGGELDPPSGADLLWSPGAQQEIVSLISAARHEVLVENEEMDDPQVTAALASVARRGVRVVIVMTRDARWNQALDELDAAGAQVRVYPDTETGLYIHAKVVVVDPGTSSAQVYVGSQNFSISSLDYNRELGVVTSSPAVTSPLATLVTADAAGGEAWR